MKTAIKEIKVGLDFGLVFNLLDVWQFGMALSILSMTMIFCKIN
jgi:hypothetical protein